MYFAYFDSVMKYGMTVWDISCISKTVCALQMKTIRIFVQNLETCVELHGRMKSFFFLTFIVCILSFSNEINCKFPRKSLK